MTSKRYLRLAQELEAELPLLLYGGQLYLYLARVAMLQLNNPVERLTEVILCIFAS